MDSLDRWSFPADGEAENWYKSCRDDLRNDADDLLEEVWQRPAADNNVKQVLYDHPEPVYVATLNTVWLMYKLDPNGEPYMINMGDDNEL